MTKTKEPAKKKKQNAELEDAGERPEWLDLDLAQIRNEIKKTGSIESEEEA